MLARIAAASSPWSSTTISPVLQVRRHGAERDLQIVEGLDPDRTDGHPPQQGVDLLPGEDAAGQLDAALSHSQLDVPQSAQVLASCARTIDPARGALSWNIAAPVGGRPLPFPSPRATDRWRRRRRRWSPRWCPRCSRSARRSSSSTLSTPTCAQPLPPPPASASPMRGRPVTSRGLPQLWPAPQASPATAMLSSTASGK